MINLADKFDNMAQNAKKATYEFSNGTELVIRRRKNEWHINALSAEDKNFEIWIMPKIFDTFDDVINYIVDCEIENMIACVKYLNDFCNEEVKININRNWVRTTVLHKIKEWKL